MFDVKDCKFPETTTDEYFKYTSKKVVGFAGLQIRNGAYGSISSPEKSDGTIHFCCDKDLPSEEFLDVVVWIEENALDVLDKSLESFVQQYRYMRDLVIDSLTHEKADDVVPQIATHKDLSRLCGIVAVHIKGSSTVGIPRFGIEFGCNWEEEHGAGVNFEGLELVETGSASEGFDFE
ncbi:DUF6985 domain-containing protein [Vibrio neptunius]|uniref:DUF6985 domain-containing protein n=1 Tax=Vibrio neptunius TaxID=170651 RepID=UPI0019D00494|nr:hypothetical protein [Vibrio neptunius]MBN3575965.1 hypothetical protein [Vibrio neptunius]QXX05855.1 hypothetical protein KW548_11845 [Vibrio neptunius]